MDAVIYGFIVAICIVVALAIILFWFGVHMFNRCEDLQIQIDVRDELIEKQNSLIDEYRKGQR